MFSSDFIPFLIRAKKATYASGIAPAFSSRPASHDLHYEELPYLYIDTYLGGYHFIGEEVVWKEGAAIWGMNYYGKMLVKDIPEGFGLFLKEALTQVPVDAPYRGPAEFKRGSFTFRCTWKGDVSAFEGEEDIFQDDVKLYHLVFHGGEIQN